MNKKRILIVNYEFPPLGGGGGVAAKLLAEGYIENGYEVDYITTKYKNQPAREEVDGINVFRIPVIGRNDLSTASLLSMLCFPFFSLPQTVILLLKRDYFFIHAHFAIPSALLTVVIAKLFRIKHVLSIYGGDIYDPTKKYSPHKNILFKQVVKYVLRMSDIIVAESTDIQTKAQEIFNAKNVKVIPVAYKPNFYKKLNRHKLNLKSNSIYLISIGRLVKRKGFDWLIRLLASLPPQYELLLIGQGPELKELTQLADELCVSNRVHFLGFIDNEKKFQYLEIADIYVLSSLHEGFGIVLQEAMQVGLPIVLRNSEGGPAEVLGDSFFSVDELELAYAASKIGDLKKSAQYEKLLKKYLPKKVASLYLKQVYEK